MARLPVVAAFVHRRPPVGPRPWAGGLLLVAGLTAGCTRSPEAVAIRLTDVFDASRVEGSTGRDEGAVRRTEWLFDGPLPRPTPAARTTRAPAARAATRGWEAGPGVSGLVVRDGLLLGRTTSDLPIVHLQRMDGLDNSDQLHAVEIRLRVSKGTNLFVATRPGEAVDLPQEAAVARRLPWAATTPVMAGDRLQTYVIVPPAPVSGSRIRHILIRPTDVAGAEFGIASVRLVFRNEHLAGLPSGVSWQGLRDVFRETLVTRSPESVRFALRLPSRPILDLSLGTPEDQPVTFTVSVRRAGVETAVMTRTVTTPLRWERRVVDLGAFAGSAVELSLAASADKKGTLAFWGAPAVRQRAPRTGDGGPPQIVLLIQGDTLRVDHLDVYGYERRTAPVLHRLADEGALFRHAITQTSWTKAATPAVMTSLYPSTHGVHKIIDRLPASATTIAEAFRDAGYATLSFSSVSFTGQFTNLHQGFEELHESESAVGRAGPRGSKTAREFVDRFVDWLDGHRDVRVFAYLHFFDPHSPYEPNRPFDTLWADPKGREEYVRQQEILKKVVADAFLAQRGMATPEELARAGIDEQAFIRYSKDLYDGSIRGMDAEIGRLVERLRDLGLDRRSLLAFFSDHGEEFHDHGRMWHGQGVYGEMIRVPLILWAPGRIPEGLRVDEPVELIDVMPTLLEASGARSPDAAQGQSLRPLLRRPGGDGVVEAASAWERRPLIAEKQPMGGRDFPGAGESYALIEGRWKLIHNAVRADGKPEFELYDFYGDPLDRKDVARDYPQVVQRLARALDAWKEKARAARLKADADAADLSATELERLRSLGYIQ
jgi:arylsulfatase A-like enzyme